MASGENRIILASASPRRMELLASAGIDFEVFAGNAPEEILPGEQPLDHVLRLARDKALEVAARVDGRFFIGADTIVLCDGEIMGKPKDAADAERMLRAVPRATVDVVTDEHGRKVRRAHVVRGGVAVDKGAVRPSTAVWFSGSADHLNTGST